MTPGQYQALIAYLQHWPKPYPQFWLDFAIKDLTIADSREEVLSHLKKCGWVHEEPTGVLRYQG